MATAAGATDASTLPGKVAVGVQAFPRVRPRFKGAITMNPPLDRQCIPDTVGDASETGRFAIQDRGRSPCLAGTMAEPAAPGRDANVAWTAMHDVRGWGDCVARCPPVAASAGWLARLTPRLVGWKQSLSALAKAVYLWGETPEWSGTHCGHGRRTANTLTEWGQETQATGRPGGRRPVMESS